VAAANLRAKQLQQKAGCSCRVTISESENGNVVILHEGTAPIVVRPEGEWTTAAIAGLKKAHERVTLRHMAREAYLLGED